MPVLNPLEMGTRERENYIPYTNSAGGITAGMAVQWTFPELYFFIYAEVPRMYPFATRICHYGQ